MCLELKAQRKNRGVGEYANVRCGVRGKPFLQLVLRLLGSLTVNNVLILQGRSLHAGHEQSSLCECLFSLRFLGWPARDSVVSQVRGVLVND